MIKAFVCVDEGVEHIHCRCYRTGGLVHVAVEREMRVAVDYARHHELARSVDDGSPGGSRDVGPDLRDLAVMDQHAAVLDHTMGDGKHSPVSDQKIGMR